MSGSPLGDALARKQVLICVGAGGVGKTTIAAALAVRAAVEGKPSLVCTIDPARRLANSLGLSELGNEELRIPDERWAAAALSARAPMHAMMLDMKRTWDEMIERSAPADVHEKILSNRFYQSLSTRLAGSQEYIAMEKLAQLRAKSEYALVVLDTPPTSHALDFLDAPNRVLDFLDHEAARWLLTPALAAGKFGLKLFNLGGSYAARQLSKLTGSETLQELAGFMLAMSGMNEEFRQRAQQTRMLLGAESTGFVLVAGPALERLDEAIQFHTVLRQSEMRVVAVVVNRVHLPTPKEAWEALSHLPPALRAKVEKTLQENDVLAASDAEGIARLKEQCDPTPLVQVPRFEQDVHDLSSLWRTGQHLLGEA